MELDRYCVVRLITGLANLLEFDRYCVVRLITGHHSWPSCAAFSRLRIAWEVLLDAQFLLKVCTSFWDHHQQPSVSSKSSTIIWTGLLLYVGFRAWVGLQLLY